MKLLKNLNKVTKSILIFGRFQIHRKEIFIYTVVLAFSIYLVSCAFKEPKSVIEPKEGIVGLVGYGSLISPQSMEETLEHKYQDSIYLVHIDGFKREWTDLTFTNEFTDASVYNFFYLVNRDSIPVDGMISLNISQDKNYTINGVLYFIKESDLPKFDERESGYQRIDITSSLVEFDIKNANVYTYQALPDHLYRTNFIHKEYVILKEYTDFVYQACDSIGKSFRREFDESTIPYDSAIRIGTVVQRKKR